MYGKTQGGAKGGRIVLRRGPSGRLFPCQHDGWRGGSRGPTDQRRPPPTRDALRARTPLWNRSLPRRGLVGLACAKIGDMNARSARIAVPTPQ